jgi:hypothetical protein
VADINIQGQVGYLAQRMQADAWADFWLRIDDVRGTGRHYLP